LSSKLDAKSPPMIIMSIVCMYATMYVCMYVCMDGCILYTKPSTVSQCMDFRNELLYGTAFWSPKLLTFFLILFAFPCRLTSKRKFLHLNFSILVLKRLVRRASMQHTLRLGNIQTLWLSLLGGERSWTI